METRRREMMMRMGEMVMRRGYGDKEGENDEEDEWDDDEEGL